MWNVFIFGGWPIITFWVAFIILDYILVYKEAFGGITIALVVQLALTWVFSQSTVEYIFGVIGFWELLMWIAISIIPIGIPWACYKWNRILSVWKSIYFDHLREFMENENLTYDGKLKDYELPAQKKKEFNEFLESGRHSRRINEDLYWDKKVPHPKDSAGDIAGWIAYWPLSVIGTFFGEMLRDIGLALYRTVGKVFWGMSKRTAKSVGKT